MVSGSHCGACRQCLPLGDPRYRGGFRFAYDRRSSRVTPSHSPSSAGHARGGGKARVLDFAGEIRVFHFVLRQAEVICRGREFWVPRHLDESGGADQAAGFRAVHQGFTGLFRRNDEPRHCGCRACGVGSRDGVFLSGDYRRLRVGRRSTAVRVGIQSADEDVAHSSRLSEPRRIELELVPIRVACGVVGSVFAVGARKKGDGDSSD